jgi:hypothetical protein
LGPLALVILGGLVTTMTYTLCIVPALYARFGAGVVHEAVDDADLEFTVAGEQRFALGHAQYQNRPDVGV